MNNRIDYFWYHCGHCGQLFQSDSDKDGPHACSLCGEPPQTGLFPAIGNRGEEPETEPQVKGKGKEKGKGRSSGSPRKNKKGKLGVLKVVLVWLVLMALALGTHRYFRGLRIEEARAEAEQLRVEKRRASLNREASLEEALMECHKVLAGFISSSVAEKAAYIWKADENSGDLAEVYGAGKYGLLKVASIERIDQGLFEINGETIVETRWVQDGLGTFEAVFRKEEGGWKLDWKHFSRASDMSWELLLGGDGTADGEFRLFAKIPETDESETDEEVMKVAVFSADFPDPAKLPEDPLVLEIDRDTEEGLLLSAAFALENGDKNLFGRSFEPSQSAGVIRIRVRLGRRRVGDIVKFELKRVIACHWIDMDATGFDIARLKDDLFLNK